MCVCLCPEAAADTHYRPPCSCCKCVGCVSGIPGPIVRRTGPNYYARVMSACLRHVAAALSAYCVLVSAVRQACAGSRACILLVSHCRNYVGFCLEQTPYTVGLAHDYPTLCIVHLPVCSREDCILPGNVAIRLAARCSCLAWGVAAM